MKSLKTLSMIWLVSMLVLAGCGGAPNVSPTPVPTETQAPTPTSPPTSTSAPTEPATPKPTVDPNAVVPGGKLVIGIAREPDVISPIMANETLEQVISWFFVEGLVQIDSNGNPVPVLAEELPTLSEDGLSLTYTLKPGVRFSNGDPFTCADIQFTWKAVMYYLTPISKAGYELIQAVDCPDENTAVVRFTSGYAQYLQLFSFILPQGAGSLDSVTKWDYHQAPIGTGPWKVLEWQVGDHILLVRNEYYREPGKPYLENIELKFLKYRENSVDLLSKGQLDVAWGLDESFLLDLDSLASQGISYSAAQSGINELIVFNLADPKLDAPVDPSANPHPILSDLRVRQAFQLAIDKQALVDELLSGSVQVSSSVLASGASACAFPPSEYNPEKAKTLLDEAGWRVGADGIREKDGMRLSLKITTEADSQLRSQIQQALVEEMKAIGVELLVENVSSKEFNASWKAGGLRKHGHFDILLYASGPGISPAVALKRDFHSSRIPTAYNQGAGNNFSRYRNADVDAWIDQSLSITNSDQQQELFCKIAEQINKDVPVIAIYEHLLVSAHRDRLNNFVVSPGPANFTLGSQNWWLSP